MKSKITIDMDWDNQPIIKIQYEASEDVRDKMIKRFLETFRGESCLATFFFENTAHEQTNKTATIRPLPSSEFKEYLSYIQEKVEEEKSREEVKSQ